MMKMKSLFKRLMDTTSNNKTKINYQKDQTFLLFVFLTTYNSNSTTNSF
jgi:hypothetical protein